jgi:hypothetical protein
MEIDGLQNHTRGGHDFLSCPKSANKQFIDLQFAILSILAAGSTTKLNAVNR